MAERELFSTKDFPGNKIGGSSSKTPAKKKQVKQVAKGRVIKRKKSLGNKFRETFLEDDTGSVGSYILYEVIIPAAKSTITDMVTGGIEMLLYGETRGRASRDKGRGYVSYGSYYDKDCRNDRDRARPSTRARHNFDDVILDSRGEAEDVIGVLVDLIDEYGDASVADLYDAVGMDSSYTDRKYGWTNLRDARPRLIRGGGYLLDLPKPRLID